MARDLLVHHALGTPPERATRDVDIALAVASWSDLDEVMAGYPAVDGSPHSFLVAGIAVDVVPFRGVQRSDRTIRWANDHVMDVFGFEEAFASAHPVELPHAVVVRVASLPAQTLLQVMAWRDRRYDTREDAVDLRALLLAGSQGDNLDELYRHHADVLETYDYDPVGAAAHVVGVQARALVDPPAAARVLDLFDDDFLDALSAAGGSHVLRTREMLHAYRRGWAGAP